MDGVFMRKLIKLAVLIFAVAFALDLVAIAKAKLFGNKKEVGSK